MDVIRPSRADPPALIFASRRSFRNRACSAVDWARGVALDDAAAASPAEGVGDTPSILKYRFAKLVFDEYVAAAGFVVTTAI